VTKRNPNLDAAQKLYPVILKLMGEFGMTPNSRSKKLNPLIGDNKPSGSSDDGWADV
jgi:phage terminase small subunit